MARLLLAIVVLLGLSVVGCRRGEDESTKNGTQGTGETYKAPSTQPDVSVTEPPATPEPTERQSPREEGMRPEAGTGQDTTGGERGSNAGLRDQTEERRGEGGTATAPAGSHTGGDEGSPG